MGKNDNENTKIRLRQLVDLLNAASKAYYAEDKEIMSNYEYDELYDELVRLEASSGVVLSDSPTINVGYEAVDFLPKQAHEKAMLSLGKTKDRQELKNWLNGHEALLSWKMDGLTIVLTYDDGQLNYAVTRGNGEIGEVITNNAKAFKNVPVKIGYKGHLIVRGEAIITYSDFEKINETITDADAKYKNPRNLCSGSVRQLDSAVTAKRSVRFYAFNLVAGDTEFETFESQFEFLKNQGFDIVEYKMVDEENILDTIEWFAGKIADNDIPSDGLVLSYNDLAYAQSLGRTAKFPRGAIAFKWADEKKETVLRQIEWSPSRTGLINPVAIFDTIDLEGTNVSRASVHNISIMEELRLGIGDHITVYKANMIIPQIAENLTGSGNVRIPSECPVCQGKTEVRTDNATKMLYCTNPECSAKKIKAFTHYVERNAMNIDGLSEATLEKFIAKGFIHKFSDIYHLDKYRQEITNMDGFGEKSYIKLIDSINLSRKVSLPAFISAIGIPGIGLANAKLLCSYFGHDINRIMTASCQEIADIEGMGEVLAKAIYDYMHGEENIDTITSILKELEIEIPVVNEDEQNLKNLIFVITGSLENYGNRDELKAEIERRGGKVTGSVTGKTTALINNDATSQSSKNKKAAQLGVRVITESEFISEYLS